MTLSPGEITRLWEKTVKSTDLVAFINKWWKQSMDENVATLSDMEITLPDMEITKSVTLPEYNFQNHSLRKHFTLKKLEGKLSKYSKKS